MKILHLVSQDSGGAGRATLRIHQALLEQHIDSIVLVQNKTTDLSSVQRLAKTKLQKIIEKMRPLGADFFLFPYRNKQNDIFSPNGFSNKILIRTIQKLKPDLIHLHWINNGFLNIADLAKLNIPMLWSLHDANPYTGGCHVIPNGCENFKTHCQKCPFLGSNFKFDLSYFVFEKKLKTYAKLNLTINGLSRWIADCAKESALFKDKKIINLPNPIDTRIYQPINKQIAKNLLNLEKTPKIISFGALNPTSTERKGYPQLKEALKLLKDKENIQLIVFGTSEGENIEGIKTAYVGKLSDDIALQVIYSLSDVVIVPSLSESFGQVALEAMSCGTPVVAFDCSGLKDIITHQKDGYLAKPFEATSLAQGIEWVLNLEKKEYEKLCKNAREKALQSFSSQNVAKNYIQTYANILNGGGGNAKVLKTLLFSHSKKIISFGALSGTSIPRKGYEELKIAMESLESSQDYELLVFGSSDGEKIAHITTRFLGPISDDVTLKLIYSVSDVFVTPSLAENLSNTIMESLSCGTPVVAFDIGGNSDMIVHQKNGYLAKDSKDLAKGIEWVLNLEKKEYEKLCKNAREKALQNFDSKIIAPKYIKTYKEILNA